MYRYYEEINSTYRYYKEINSMYRYYKEINSMYRYNEENFHVQVLFPPSSIIMYSELLH